MKNKGFTLVELLVVIVILGIVTGISIPIIRNVQQKMVDKKYTTYLDSLKDSAKLYNDSYSEDMFGHAKSGVYCVTYRELEKKKLIKDISVEDKSCNRDRTFVRVVKMDDKYTYTPYLACGSKNGDDVTVVLPKGSDVSMSETLCSETITNTIVVDIDERYKGSSYMSNKFDKHKRTARVKIYSATGIDNDINLQYAWKNTKDGTITSYSPLTFKIKGNQEQQILNGDIIETVSNEEIITPEGGDGLYHLLVKVNKLNDIKDHNSWKPGNNQSNPIEFKPYAIDNGDPEIRNEIFRSTETNYNSLSAYFNFDGYDEHSPNDLKMCISTSGYCTNNFQPYNKSTLINFVGIYDGSIKYVYVTLKDLAGNTAKKKVPYRVGITHTMIYNNNGGSGCSSKSVTHNVNDGRKWGTLCTPTRTGYTFKGWKSGNTTIDSNTVISDNITVTAEWQINRYTLTYNSAGGTACGAITKNYNEAWGTLCTPTRTGYTFNGWKVGNTTLTATSKATANITAVAQWSIRNYTLTINSNGGSGCSGTITKTYGSDWGLSCTPTRTGYTFNGWTINPTKATGNGTATANWKINNYTLTINSNGGSGCSGTITKPYNSAWGLSCTPSRTGYTFNGWTINPAKATGNGTATASWKINNYTLTINSNGGSGCSGTITKPYNSAWGLSCTPSRTGYTFSGWSISPAKATGNGTAKANWTAKVGWELSNPGASLTNQKWIFWNNGTRVQSGWHDFPIAGPGSPLATYYFEGGYAWCNGWWRSSSSGKWYFLSNQDIDGNGNLDCRMYRNEDRQINGKWYNFDNDGACTNGNYTCP